MDWQTRYEMLQAMRRYGGSFVVALADCFMRADEQNFAKLEQAFPEYVEQYQEMARIDKEKAARDA